MSDKHKCRKIRKGKYFYRGFEITNHGYYEPKQHVVWEGVDPKTGGGDFHGFSKREILNLIDIDLDKIAVTNTQNTILH